MRVIIDGKHYSAEGAKVKFTLLRDGRKQLRLEFKRDSSKLEDVLTVKYNKYSYSSNMNDWYTDMTFVTNQTIFATKHSCVTNCIIDDYTVVFYIIYRDLVVDEDKEERELDEVVDNLKQELEGKQILNDEVIKLLQQQLI